MAEVKTKEMTKKSGFITRLLEPSLKFLSSWKGIVLIGLIILGFCYCYTLTIYSNGNMKSVTKDMVTEVLGENSGEKVEEFFGDVKSTKNLLDSFNTNITLLIDRLESLEKRFDSFEKKFSEEGDGK